MDELITSFLDASTGERGLLLLLAEAVTALT